MASPHPAFGHPLPAARGEGQPTPSFLRFVALLPAGGGEKVAEGRMRGIGISRETRGPLTAPR